MKWDDRNLEAFKTAEIIFKHADDTVRETGKHTDYLLNFAFLGAFLYALACEIYIKSIKPSSGHNLLKLFRGLPEDVQREIAEDYDKNPENSPESQKVLQASPLKSVDYSIYKVLEAIGTSYTLFRYPYEEKFLKEFFRRFDENDNRHPYSALWAIRKYQLKRHPDWPILVA